MSIKNSAIEITPELNESFQAVVQFASSYREALKVPHEPEDTLSAEERDIVKQWVWQIMVIAPHVQDSTSEEMLKHLEITFERSRDLRGSIFGAQMGLLGYGKKLKEDGKFPGIPSIPAELLDRRVP